MSGRISLDFSYLPNVINPVFYPLVFDEHRYLNLMGGTGSGKSYFCAEKVIYRTLIEPNSRILVVRKVARTIKQSVFMLVLSEIIKWNLRSLFAINWSDMTMTCKNGNQIVFVGLDDPEKLKSLFDITSVWIEEATELMPADFEELDRRMRAPEGYGGYRQLMLSYNPISRLHWLKDRFFDSDQRGRTRSLVTTYRDNIFCDPALKDALDELQERNPGKYQVYGLAEWGDSELAILGELLFGDYPSSYDYEIFGLDFGFTNPMALMKIGMYDGAAYVDELVYQSGLTIHDLIRKLPELGVKPSSTHPIVCDSADPDKIATLQQHGYAAEACVKGSGSVQAGIDFMREIDIYSNHDNQNFNAEWGSWEWKTDKNGNVLEVPIDGNDHALDATRYPLMKLVNPIHRKQFWVA